MLKHIKRIFGLKPKEQAVEAPYKVEAPTAVSEKATQAVIESIAPAKKKPAAKKPAAKKPRSPRKPKEPKEE